MKRALVAIVDSFGGPRGLALAILGAVGFIHEIWTVGLERPFILTACCALMGVTFLFNKRNGNGGNGDKH